jgi:hypothetical protein
MREVRRELDESGRSRHSIVRLVLENPICTAKRTKLHRPPRRPLLHHVRWQQAVSLTNSARGRHHDVRVPASTRGIVQVQKRHVPLTMRSSTKRFVPCGQIRVH